MPASGGRVASRPARGGRRPRSRSSPAPASTRIMRFAFALAQSRPRKLLTVVTKSNAQRHGMVMWDEIAAEVAAEFPDVTWDKMLVDAMTMRMVLQAARRSTPSSPPTCTPTSCPTSRRRWPARSASRRPRTSTPSARFPSMFEPIHGSAFDITGKGIANPIGTFWIGVDDAGASGRAGGGGAADARRSSGSRRTGAAHARSRRQGDDAPGDGRGDRGDRGGQCASRLRR